MQRPVCLFIFLLVLLQSHSSFSQNDFFQPAPQYNQQRLRGVVIAESVITSVAFIGLDFLWYKKFPHSGFHFFNDNGEWLQMDKVGHAFSAYTIAAIQNDLLLWSGVKPSSAAIAGSATSLGIMSMIEVLDGFSSEWGFSKGDMLANLTGITVFQSQQWMWNEQRVSIKFSYHFTDYSKYDPQLLGKNWRERLVKDYNGQTYWLSGNIASFLSSSTSFPKWLNVAAGYGADGMIGGRKNPAEVNGQPVPETKRYRQFYFSFDTDLYRINDLSPWAVTFLKLNRTLKTPSPTLEWNNSDAQFTMHDSQLNSPPAPIVHHSSCIVHWFYY